MVVNKEHVITKHENANKQPDLKKGMAEVPKNAGERVCIKQRGAWDLVRLLPN